MMLFPFADIDLANAPAFEAGELAAVRDLVAHGQRMARIGNWIAIWQRELAEGDYSAGVVARALESGIVSADELRALRAEATDATDATDATVDRIVDRIREAGIEAEFVERWRREYDAATDLEGEIDSVDVRAYLDGFRPIFRSQLARRPSE